MKRTVVQKHRKDKTFTMKNEEDEADVHEVFVAVTTMKREQDEADTHGPLLETAAMKKEHAEFDIHGTLLETTTIPKEENKANVPEIFVEAVTIPNQEDESDVNELVYIRQRDEERRAREREKKRKYRQNEEVRQRERERDRIRKQLTRNNESRRERERLAKQRMRQDEQKRILEQERNRVAKRLMRLDPERRKLLQERDKLAKRLIRQDPQRREILRERDKLSKRARRARMKMFKLEELSNDQSSCSSYSLRKSSLKITEDLQTNQSGIENLIHKPITIKAENVDVEEYPTTIKEECTHTEDPLCIDLDIPQDPLDTLVECLIPIKEEPDLNYGKREVEFSNFGSELLETKIDQPLNSRADIENQRDHQELISREDLDAVDLMFLDFAKRFKQFSSKRQLAVKTKFCQIMSQAEMEEIEERQRYS